MSFGPAPRHGNHGKSTLPLPKTALRSIKTVFASPEPDTNTPPMLAAALGYARVGLKIFPVWGVIEQQGKLICACSRGANCPENHRGKHPITGNGYQDATTDEHIIREWWAKHPTANIGLSIRNNGLVAFDFDPRNGANESEAALTAKYGQFPTTLKQLSGGGGHHLIFKDSPDLEFAAKLATGIDIKSNGYVIVAPSKHISGGVYQWNGGNFTDLGQAAELPPQWVDLARKTNKKPAITSTDKIAQNLIGSEFVWPNQISDGEGREAFIIKAAGHLRNKNHDQTGIERILLDYNRAHIIPPLDEEIVLDRTQRYESRNTPVNAAQRFRLRSVAEVIAKPPATWLVKWVIPDRGLVAVFGQSGAGKSFLIISLLACIAKGSDWFGRKVQASPVVYVALEGIGGISKRLQAWEKYHNAKLPPTFSVVTDPLSLFSNGDIPEFSKVLTASGFTGGIIAIDTLNASAPGADENVSKDMGLIIDHAKQLQQATDSVVLLVHHTGKDQSKGLRGHSSLTAALDSTIEVRKDNGKVWQLDKTKDGPEGVPQPFKLEVVLLGKDVDGEDISSCVAVPDPAAVISAISGKPSGKLSGANQKIALKIVRKLLQAIPAGSPLRIPIDDAVDAIGKGLAVDNKRKNERARAAINGLVADERLFNQDGWLSEEIILPTSIPPVPVPNPLGGVGTSGKHAFPFRELSGTFGKAP